MSNLTPVTANGVNLSPTVFIISPCMIQNNVLVYNRLYKESTSLDKSGSQQGWIESKGKQHSWKIVMVDHIMGDIHIHHSWFIDQR